MISKSVSTSKKVNLKLRNPLDCLLYTWGLTHADDDGRIDGHATIFRAIVAPALPGLTDNRVESALIGMVRAGLILRYTVKEVMVVQFLAWEENQSFHGYHRSPSSFPPPPQKTEITQSGATHPNGCRSGAEMVLKVNEVKIKESKLNKEKIKYLDFVHLSPQEYSNLLNDYGKTQTTDLITRLNDYIGSKGDKYKSHYFTLLNFARRDNIKKITPAAKFTPSTPPPAKPLTAEELKQAEEFQKTLGKIGNAKKVMEANK